MSDGSTYSAAGVDIDKAQQALRSVKDAVEATHGERVLGGVGGFGGMFDASFGDMDRPVLVTSVDGVGTKTKVAAMVGDFSGIGRDIVNHCVNDILCQGARPLFFLDYFGCSRLDAKVFEQVVTSAASACSELDCALIGGETAEMPGVYQEGESDVVGCIVGVVDYKLRLPRETAKPGDCLIGIASDGLHTNGFSLARRVLFELSGHSVSDTVGGTDETVGDALLRPHRCYYNPLRELLSEPGLSALAHVTGGGLYDNLARVLPVGSKAVIDRSSWETPAIFKLIQSSADIDAAEMHRAFNMGIGMVAVVDKGFAESALAHLKQCGERAAVIGELQIGSKEVQIV